MANLPVILRAAAPFWHLYVVLQSCLSIGVLRLAAQGCLFQQMPYMVLMYVKVFVETGLWHRCCGHQDGSGYAINFQHKFD